MKLSHLIFRNFFILTKSAFSLIRKANYQPSLKVNQTTDINNKASVFKMSLSLTNVLIVRINDRFFCNPRTESELILTIPITDKNILTVQAYGLLKKTKIISFDLSNATMLSFKDFKANLKTQNKLNIFSSQKQMKLNKEKVVEINVGRIELKKLSIGIKNQGVNLNQVHHE